MKNLVGNGKDFEFNSKINRKPMEIVKYQHVNTNTDDLQVGSSDL